MGDQDAVNNFWRDLINDPELVKTERNWSAWIRVKYDALKEVGFSDHQALGIVMASLKIVQNKNIFKGNITED